MRRELNEEHPEFAPLARVIVYRYRYSVLNVTDYYVLQTIDVHWLEH